MRQKTLSSERPAHPYEVENIRNGYCTVLFFTNIEELTDEEGNTYYEYDLYVLYKVNYRDTLEKQIEDNYEQWLNMAIEYDYDTLAKEIRAKRDTLLNNTDWTQMADTALSAQEQEAYRRYRQALRDVPEQEGFPYEVVWPGEIIWPEEV